MWDNYFQKLDFVVIVSKTKRKQRKARVSQCESVHCTCSITQKLETLLEYASPLGIHVFNPSHKHSGCVDVLSGTRPAEGWISAQLTYDGLRSLIRQQECNDKVTERSIGPAWGRRIRAYLQPRGHLTRSGSIKRGPAGGPFKSTAKDVYKVFFSLWYVLC